MSKPKQCWYRVQFPDGEVREFDSFAALQAFLKTHRLPDAFDPFWARGKCEAERAKA